MLNPRHITFNDDRPNILKTSLFTLIIVDGYTNVIKNSHTQHRSMLYHADNKNGMNW